ncbi:TPA: hypothetical protein ACQJT5_004685 [Vibrio parahaemolyticus]
MDISNQLFLQAIFGEKYPLAHVTSFTQDPGNIPTGESGRCWAGGYFKDTPLIPNSNQYYTVSLFTPTDEGKANRRKANFTACYVIALDDVKEKLPIDQVMRLPPPSIVLKSSLYSEQWLYLLTEPCGEASQVDNLHDGLIKNGLAPNSKDPGQKGVTRYLRLPEGVNTKGKRVTENGGIAPRCTTTEWHPERRYTLQQLATPFGVDINAPRADKRVDGASAISDHPLLHTNAIQIKGVISDGRYDCTCPWVDEHTGNADNGSAIFTNADGSIGYRCHHGSCETRTGADLLKYIELHDPGFNERLKQWQVLRELTDVATSNTPVNSTTPESTLLANTSPLAKLRSMVADGDALLKQMVDDKFVLKDLAILGQWTVFYAGPNTGKTLLTQWLLREAVTIGGINGDDVFYLNVDDTAKAGAEKAKMATEFGYQMILSSVKGFKARDVLGLIDGMVSSGEANGKVLIMDTLKKFTDLMDKKLSSDFGHTARNFVAAGGTLICLAHVNKHKDAEGNSVYAGTSDIRDDADGVFTIEHHGSFESGLCKETHTVEFKCSKSRGDVAQSVTFQYTKEKGTGYRAMFDSVERLEGEDAQQAQMNAIAANEQSNDAEVIEAIRASLTNHVRTQGDIIKFIMTTTSISKYRVRQTLNKYEGQLWDCTKGLNNSSNYSMKVAPELNLEPSFF